MLFEQLQRRSAPIADIYSGGLLVLVDETNPYRFQLAAHAFRELIAHCPSLTGGSVVFGDNMKQRLVPVKKAFEGLRRLSTLTPDPTINPTGLSDALNEALEDFFEWNDTYQAENRRKTALLLSQLSGTGPALPSDVVADEISRWIDSDTILQQSSA